MDNNEFQKRFFKLEDEVGGIEKKLAILISQKPQKQIHEIHIIFDNPLEINDQTKVKELEAGITKVVKQIQATVKDINKTPLK